MVGEKKKELLTQASDIAKMQPYWDKVSAIVKGLDAMREATTTFLPKFPAETKDDYDVRLSSSKFTNIYRDVLEGLATKPFEEEVSIIGGDEVPTQVWDFIEDVDGYGNNLSMFSALTFFNGINYAVDWIFVDYPNTTAEGQVVSQARARQLNLRPFWSRVLAKNILEIKTKMVGSKELLTYVRIFEPESEDSPDSVRIFERDDQGLVKWQLWDVSGDDAVSRDLGELSIDIIPLIPFITGRRDGRGWNFYPAMQDAADLQITLYQNESALEYIKTLACYPMLAANGMKPAKDASGNPEKVAIGPARVLYGVPDGAGNHGEWRFIEPSANSMEFLQKNIDKTKQDLRELGRQPLTALSTQLTTVTTSIAAGKARSAVTAWALGLKDTLENALLISMKWQGIDYAPEVNVYTGFDNVMDDGSDLEALQTMRERGDLSQETFWFEMKRRKVLSPEFKADEEVSRILNEIPFNDLGISETDDDINQTEGNDNV